MRQIRISKKILIGRYVGMRHPGRERGGERRIMLLFKSRK
jgi:hypothetical protein